MSQSASPRFSVIIPTRDRPQVLPRAIRSVLTQSFADFELLVVDDASAEPIGSLLADHDDPRLILLERREPGGAAVARNHGLRRASGELIAFLDDDDEFLPDFLVETDRSFARAGPAVGLSWCGVQWVEDRQDAEIILREEIWQPRFASREEAYLGFLRNRRVGTNCGLTLRRQLLHTVGLFDESLLGAEDTDYLIRAVRRHDFIVVPKIMVKIHLHRGGHLRSQLGKQAAAYNRIINKHSETLRRHPALFAHLHYKAAWLHYHAGDRRTGRHFMSTAFRRRPLHIKAWLATFLFEILGRQAPNIHRGLSRLKAKIQRMATLRPE